MICSGARNFSPGEPPADVFSIQGTLDFYAKANARLREAKSIMVVGSGPVAVELCGELRTYLNKDTTITLAMESELLAHVQPPLSKKAKESLLKLLVSAKIKVLSNVTVTSPEVGLILLFFLIYFYYFINLQKNKIPLRRSTADAICQVPDNMVKFKSGEIMMNVDLVIFATGGIPQSSFVPKKFMDESGGEVQVDSFLRVRNAKDIFCFGDVAKTERTKLGLIAMLDAAVVAKNIKRVLDGKEPNVKMTKTTSNLLVSFGNKQGKYFSSLGIFGNGISSLIKSKGLFAGYIWQTFGAKGVP